MEREREKPKSMEMEYQEMQNMEDPARVVQVSRKAVTCGYMAWRAYFYERFLKSKKKKDKKKKKKDQIDNVSTGSPDREDGEVRKDSFYSSSDDDSDDEGVGGKFRVEIKPPVVKDRHATAGDSLEELKATVGGLTLSPSPAASVKLRKEASRQQLQRSRSESQSQEDVFTYLDSMSTAGLGTSTFNSNSKPSNDLLGLDLFSSPLGTAPPISAASFSQSHSASASPEPWGLPSPSSELPPALPAKQRQLTPSTLPVPLSATPPPTGAGDASSVLPEQEKISRPPMPGAQPVLPLPPKTGRAKPIPAPRQQPSPDDMIPGHVSPPIHVTSAAPLARAESLSSISSGTFSTAGTPTAGTSRGPSPLPAGSGTETVIPVAAAFSETVNAFFKGTDQDKCMVKITGDLMMSFPHGIISALTTNPTLTPLTFRIKNSSRLEQVLPNKTLITLDPTQSQLDAQAYTFNMPALLTYLKQQADQNIGASYYNIGIMKYQVYVINMKRSNFLPHLKHKCEPLSTEIRIDYAYNEPAFPLATALTNVTIHLPVDGGVTNVQSIPNATWNAEAKRALWKIPEISKASEGGGISTLRAKFDLTEGPSKPMTMAVKFNSEGTTLSGLELELVGGAYRASLVKKRFAAEKMPLHSRANVLRMRTTRGACISLHSSDVVVGTEVNEE
uniref:MHD domain-containing protein n=1 Tax=Branchiostoma floridae TaxID=7739 RepID=C3YIJ5_BRAFL|eukprot:XP_002603917.1 hypothetical protein BRAFLDRAFT_105958 [Branchiostoma floridae]